MSDKGELTRTRIFQVNVSDKISDARISEIQNETAEDQSVQLLIVTILNSWPEHKNDLKSEVKLYFFIRDTLGHCDGVILKGETVLIPPSLRTKMKDHLHSAHLGFDSMSHKAHGNIFWLGMNKDIKQLAENCHYCMEMKPKNQKEPMRQHDDGNYP